MASLDMSTPATKFYRTPKGDAAALDVFMSYSKPDHPFDAIAAFQAGATVFVAREHAPDVAAALGITYGR